MESAVPRCPRRPRRLVLPALLAGVALAGLLLAGDPARRLPLTLACLGAGFVALLWASRLLPPAPSVAALLLVAAVARLALLPLAPTLSQDLWRYLWDGEVAARGLNPYEHAPDAAALRSLRSGRDELWQRLDHRGVPSVYPPLAVATWSLVVRSPVPVAVWKLIAGAADLVTCWLLVLLASELGVGRRRVIWYAWNPLVVLETAGMGHVDAIAVPFAVASVLVVVKRRDALVGGGLAAGGALAKLVPLAAVPMWARNASRPARFVLAALGIVAVAVLPVVVATGGIPPGLVTYAVAWEFNGPIYAPLWRAIDLVGLAAGLKHGLDLMEGWTGRHGILDPVYSYVYPQLLAKLVLGVAACWLVVMSWRRRDVVVGSRDLFGGLMLCSATVYPWYLLWVVPWAALSRGGAWLTLSASVLLVYLFPDDSSLAWPWMHLLVWMPPLAVWLWSRRGRLRP